MQATPDVDGAERSTPDVETDLSDCDEVHRCPRCDRPFRRERQRDLHLGEAHGDLSPAEQETFEEADQAEEDDLFFFHLKVVIALGVLYSSTVLLYTAIVGLTG
jgi:hypothetical protein